MVRFACQTLVMGLLGAILFTACQAPLVHSRSGASFALSLGYTEVKTLTAKTAPRQMASPAAGWIRADAIPLAKRTPAVVLASRQTAARSAAMKASRYTTRSSARLLLPDATVVVVKIADSSGAVVAQQQQTLSAAPEPVSFSDLRPGTITVSVGAYSDSSLSTLLYGNSTTLTLVEGSNTARLYLLPVNAQLLDNASLAQGTLPSGAPRAFKVSLSSASHFVSFVHLPVGVNYFLQDSTGAPVAASQGVDERGSVAVGSGATDGTLYLTLLNQSDTDIAYSFNSLEDPDVGLVLIAPDTTQPRFFSPGRASDAFFLGTVYDVTNFGNGVSLDPSSGTQGAFIVRYDSSGKAQWVQAPTYNSSSGSVDWLAWTSDSSGSSYVLGSFYNWSGNQGTVDFGNGVSLTDSSSLYNVDFVVKYDAGGKAHWVAVPTLTLSGQSAGMVTLSGLDCDYSGHVVVVGQSSQAGETASLSFFTNAGASSVEISGPQQGTGMLIVQLETSDASVNWARTASAGSSAYSWAQTVSVRADGALAITGMAGYGTSIFDAGAGQKVTINNVNESSGLMLVLADAAGNVQAATYSVGTSEIGAQRVRWTSYGPLAMGYGYLSPGQAMAFATSTSTASDQLNAYRITGPDMGAALCPLVLFNNDGTVRAGLVLDQFTVSIAPAAQVRDGTIVAGGVVTGPTTEPNGAVVGPPEGSGFQPVWVRLDGNLQFLSATVLASDPTLRWGVGDLGVDPVTGSIASGISTLMAY